MMVPLFSGSSASAPWRIGRGATLLALCLLAALAPWAAAAPPDFGAQVEFGSGSDATRAIATGDLDGDGHLDIVVGNDSEQSFVYLNDGVGGFYDGIPANCDAVSAEVRCFGDPALRVSSLAVGDVNSDGQLDIVAGALTGQSAVFLNDGRANFTRSVPLGTANDRTRGVALGDVNDDGRLDVVAARPIQNVVFLNTDAGFYTGDTSVCDPSAKLFRCFGTGKGLSVALGDVNGDDRLDIVTGHDRAPGVAVSERWNGELRAGSSRSLYRTGCAAGRQLLRRRGGRGQDVARSAGRCRWRRPPGHRGCLRWATVGGVPERSRGGGQLRGGAPVRAGRRQDPRPGAGGRKRRRHAGRDYRPLRPARPGVPE